MKYLVLFILVVVAGNTGVAQCHAGITVNGTLKDTCSFKRQWDYPWYILKGDDGKFESAKGDKITRADTQHLYYTANCSTNVQGGYDIRYCYARLQHDTLVVTLSDGAPAYMSSYTLNIAGDSVIFLPHTVYPSAGSGKITYTIKRASVVLQKRKYKTGDLLIGHLDLAFTEQSAAYADNETYFVRGDIRCKVK